MDCLDCDCDWDSDCLASRSMEELVAELPLELDLEQLLGDSVSISRMTLMQVNFHFQV